MLKIVHLNAHVKEFNRMMTFRDLIEVFSYLLSPFTLVYGPTLDFKRYRDILHKKSDSNTTSLKKNIGFFLRFLRENFDSFSLILFVIFFDADFSDFNKFMEYTRYKQKINTYLPKYFAIIGVAVVHQLKKLVTSLFFL